LIFPIPNYADAQGMANRRKETARSVPKNMGRIGLYETTLFRPGLLS
jgi:hypothetical protein